MNESVIITGAGSGIGRATALVFAAQGYTVIASGRRMSKLEETGKLPEGSSGRLSIPSLPRGTAGFSVTG